MKTIVEHLESQFPHFTSELKAEIIKHGRLMHLKEGDELMSIGGEFKLIPLITEGAIKVLREDEDGHELFLYYLRPGQTCAMSLNCFLMSKSSEVHASAEEDTTVIGISVQYASEWFSKFDDWRNFVLNTYQMRFQEMLSTIDGIAFKHLDERLYDYLKEKSAVHDNREIQMTHQKIADDLNSTREVISRLLKILEKNGRIKLGRSKIELV